MACSLFDVFFASEIWAQPVYLATMAFFMSVLVRDTALLGSPASMISIDVAF